jgi:hypothetical protein
MEQTTAIIKKDGSASKPWCLHMSNRTECFKTREQAIRREKQVTFFKNRGKSSLVNSAEEAVVMAQLGIIAEYINESDNEILYLIDDDSKIEAYLVSSDGETIERIEESTESYDKYKEIVTSHFENNQAQHIDEHKSEIKKFKLSESIINEQLIKGSHTHSVELKDGSGFSSEDHGHKHYVHNFDGTYSVGYAPVEIAGMLLTHRHMVVIQPSKK